MLFSSWPALARIILVGLLAYVSLVALLRVSGKRTLSKMNAFDLVVTVAFGSVLATTMLSKQTALAEGVVAMAVLILAQYAVAKGSIRWRTFERVVKSEPRLLVFRGEVRGEALREERVSHEEVRAALREHGVARLEDAAAVVLETDGTLTVFSSLPPGPPAAVLAGVEGAPGPPPSVRHDRDPVD